MRMTRLERLQRLATGIDAVWEFMSHPANLALITPPDLGFTLASPLPERMHPGTIATYTVSPFGGLRVGWVTEITHVREPFLFVDEQRFGPYRFWHHQHHFRAIDGGVEMRAIVHYVLPFDPFSRVIAGRVARRLDGIFDFRREALARMFDGKLHGGAKG